MALKLMSSGGGSVTLDVPSTASNLAMTVPAATGALITTEQSVGFKNKIHNGNFQVWQRGDSTTDTTAFSADRWGPIINGSGGTTTRSKLTSSLPPDQRVAAALRLEQTVSSRTSVTAYGHRQCWEINDIRDMFYGGQWTISFWYRSSSTGSHYVRLGNDQGGGSSGGSQPTVPFTVSSANTWEYKTVTLTLPALTTLPTSGGHTIGGFLDIGQSLGGSGPTTIASGFYCDVAMVQVERGSIATPFEIRPHQVELGICQRYFYIVEESYLGGFVFNGNQMAQAGYIIYPSEMRVTPTITFIKPNHITTVGNWGIYGATNGWSGAGYTPNTSSMSNRKFHVQFSGVSGVTNGDTLIISGSAFCNAEL